MKISVMGAGYVGLTTAACLAEIGHEVLCADNDEAKLRGLEAGRLPFFEPGLEAIVTRACQNGRLRFVEPAAAIASEGVLFICVGTPPRDNGEADLSAIEAVARGVARAASGYRLIVEKSTVPVQTAKRLRKHLSAYSRNGLQYDVVSNPEFLREGSAVEDFFHPDRIVVGAESSRARELMTAIYRPLLDQTFACPVHADAGCPEQAPPRLIVTDTNSAELIKHASNSFLAMKISFINMVADLCEAAGADIDKVVEGLGSDRRIGPSFLRPGIGFGGFCFPKDLQAFVRIAENFGCDFALLKEVEHINARRVEQFVAKVQKELWTLRGKKLAVWGLAFKPETDDVRFAPALAIIRRLQAEGAQVHAYDPQARAKAAQELSGVRFHDDPYAAADEAEAILLLTEWSEFRRVDWNRIVGAMARPLLFDGRNMLEREVITAHGLHYFAIGKEPAAPMIARQSLGAALAEAAS